LPCIFQQVATRSEAFKGFVTPTVLSAPLNKANSPTCFQMLPTTNSLLISSSNFPFRSKESTSYDMAEFDQSAIFLYLDGHDQEQRQTLNIFPSQPMHVAEPIPAKGVSMGMVAAMLPNGNSSPPKRQEQGGQRSPAVPPPAPTVALPNSAKETKSSLSKKEATSGGKGATSGDQERVRDPKTLRRLAQNREAARKSRLRKKVSQSTN